jgi:hypothetical protein
MNVDWSRRHSETLKRERLPRLDFSREGVLFFPMTERSEEIHVHDDHPITTTSSSPGVMASNSIKLLTGNSHPALAKDVADQSVHPVLDFIKSLLILNDAVWA